MGTKLELLNLAFAHLGEATVPDLGGDAPNPNVTKALAQLPQALDDVLSMRPWGCAVEHRQIPVDTPPSGGWGDWKHPHRFTLPKETLRVWGVEDHDGLEHWRKGAAIDAEGAARVVVRASWSGPLRAILVLRRPVEALTPLLFTAVSYMLASRLAGPIQSDGGKARSLRQEAMDWIERAEGVEASEQGGDEFLVEGPLTQARRTAL